MRVRAFERPAGEGWLEWFINAGQEMTQAGSGGIAGLETALPFFELLKSLRDGAVQGSVEQLGSLLDSGLLKGVMRDAAVESLRRLSTAATDLAAVLAPAHAEQEEDRLAAAMRLLGNPDVLKLLEPYLPDWGSSLTEVVAIFSQFPSEGSYIDQADWLFTARDKLKQYPSLAPLVAAIEQRLGSSEENLAVLRQLLQVAAGNGSASGYLGLARSMGGMLPASLTGSVGLTMLGAYPIESTGHGQ